jgi:hypothetical protein
MAKGSPKAAGAPKTATAAPAATTGAATTPKPAGKKTASAQAADPVGDICLLPDIARFAH